MHDFGSEEFQRSSIYRLDSLEMRLRRHFGRARRPLAVVTHRCGERLTIRNKQQSPIAMHGNEGLTRGLLR